MMKVADLPERYNTLVLRERVLLLILGVVLIFFFWYLLWGLTMEASISTAENKREELLSLSEAMVSSYGVSGEKQASDRDIAIIDKRISRVKSKVGAIDADIRRFNEETIEIGEIVLLLRDLLSANDGLSLESLNVYPVEIIKKKSSDASSFEDAFEKNVISLSLKGDYSSVFDYLNKVEELSWSVFWQEVKYMVDSYPTAVVNIQLYTLSIVESDRYAAQ
ncbi:MAG: MSHA biogenesis protein MshJ [Candidatus Endobugula sp.]|jgi:MSHA biogenesis protein MshJ